MGSHQVDPCLEPTGDAEFKRDSKESPIHDPTELCKNPDHRTLVASNLIPFSPQQFLDRIGSFAALFP